MTEAETAVLERLARIETDLGILRTESNALRASVQTMIQSALQTHDAAINRLSAAYDQRHGALWAISWFVAAVIVFGSAGAWLLEHRVDIVVKP